MSTSAVSLGWKPMPRVVRLGRPANDNFRGPGWRARMVLGAVTLGLLALLAYGTLAP